MENYKERMILRKKMNGKEEEEKQEKRESARINKYKIQRDAK